MGYSIDGKQVTQHWVPKNDANKADDFNKSIQGLLDRHIAYNKKQWTEFEDLSDAEVTKTGRRQTFTYKNIERTEWMDGSTLIFRMSDKGSASFDGTGSWTALKGFGGSKDDVMTGYLKDDHFQGGNGNDKIYGGAGNDQIWGEGGNDTIDGGKGRDILYGNGGNDTISGGADGDLLLGNQGNDKLYGGAGDDILLGGEGTDELTGGDGNDIFYLSAGTGVDTITDFAEGDRIAVEQKAGDKVTTSFADGVTTILLNGKAIGTAKGEVKAEDIIKGDAEGRVLKNR